MFHINPTDSTNSTFLSTEKLDSAELKLFDSIFSQTMKENNLVESSDFLNYEKGENEYIDNLIKQEATWTQELINKVINSIKILNKSNSAKAESNIYTVSLSVNNPNEIYKDTVNNANNKTVEVKFIKCTLTFEDEFGNSKEMSVNISLNFIEDYKRNNKNKDLKDLLSEISLHINKLPTNVKNDLYNEISQLMFLSPTDTQENPAKARTGYYNPADNQLAILSRKDGRSIKDCTETLIHELGHAVDDKGDENSSTSKEFNDKFEVLKNKLLKKGLIPTNYNMATAGNSYYPLTDVKEFFAEFIYNDENGGEMAYRKLHQALTKDPEIMQLTKELKDIGKKIIEERRNSSRSDRIGIKSGNLKGQLEADERINNAYSTLTLSLSDELYNKYGRGHLDNLLKAYYEFKKNPDAETEGNKLINSFITNYPNEWKIVEPLFDSHLEKQGLM